MVIVSDTLARSGLVRAVLGRFLVMAVPMEQLEIHQPVITTEMTRDDVVYFQQIPISYVQSTVSTPSLLQL